MDLFHIFVQKLVTVIENLIWPLGTTLSAYKVRFFWKTDRNQTRDYGSISKWTRSNFISFQWKKVQVHLEIGGQSLACSPSLYAISPVFDYINEWLSCINQILLQITLIETFWIIFSRILLENDYCNTLSGHQTYKYPKSGYNMEG